MRKFVLTYAVGFALFLSRASAQSPTVACFTFGPPESITRAGFTKVTVQDAFTPEKGYGFQRIDDLLAYDRGGATIERPQDEYTASAYGAFRHEVPGCQTATTLTASDLQQLGDRVDVRIYAYGHYNRAKVLREAQQGHPFWYYANGMFYGHSTIASRTLTGFEFLRSGAEGRLRDDFEGLDIHIACPIPQDPELAKQAFFYLDDVSLQAIEEPPLSVSTPLDEYYVGETLPWSVTAQSGQGPIKVELLAGRRPVAEQTRPVEADALTGAFETGSLKPGVYTLRATCRGPQEGTQSAQQQVIIAPDPFAW